MTRSAIAIIVLVLVVLIGIGLFLGVVGLQNNPNYQAANSASPTSNSSSTLAYNFSSTTASGVASSTAANLNAAKTVASNAVNKIKNTVTSMTPSAPGAPYTGGSLNSSPNTSTVKNTNTISSTNSSSSNPNLNSPDQLPRGFIYIYTTPPNTATSDAQSTDTLNVQGDSKNVPVLHMTVQAPAGEQAYVTSLVLGSDQNNAFFNSFENFRIYTTNGFLVTNLSYANQLEEYRPIFRLDEPLSLPAVTAGEFMILADLKPGISHSIIPGLTIYGGAGNVVVSANATGPTIIVK